MFHFPRFASATYLIQSRMQRYKPLRIAPFGNPRIKGRLRLPADYRGLPRPSSPAAAKASVMRPNSLSAEISAEQPPCITSSFHPRAHAHGHLDLLDFTFMSSDCQRACSEDSSPKSEQKGAWWAHMDSNHGPRPYQRRALNQLSYAPSQSDMSERWWSRRGSNPRHLACKASALATELRPRGHFQIFPIFKGARKTPPGK